MTLVIVISKEEARTAMIIGRMQEGKGFMGRKKVAGLALHINTAAYGCSVPRLTKFTRTNCKGPGH